MKNNLGGSVLILPFVGKKMGCASGRGQIVVSDFSEISSGPDGITSDGAL